MPTLEEKITSLEESLDYLCGQRNIIEIDQEAIEIDQEINRVKSLLEKEYRKL